MISGKVTKQYEREKTKTWIKLGIKAEEIKQTPNDVLAQLNQANGDLPATVVKSAELYAEMRDSSLRSSEQGTIRSVFIFCKQKRAILPFSKKFDQARSKNNMAV